MSKSPHTRVFQSYSDPGHGWARVPLALLSTLSIADKISGFSYSRGSFAYLEEDADLSIFHNAMHAAGITPVYRHYSGNKASRIRGYNRYSPNDLDAKTQRNPAHISGLSV
jgi:hypothetical protein